MSETRLGVIPDDEDETGATTEQTTATEATAATEEAPKQLSQQEVDQIVARRLAEQNQRFDAEMQRYQRQMAERDAAVVALSRELEQRRQTDRPDPYAALSPAEKELARVNAAAVEPFRQEMNTALGQMAQLIAPTLAKQTVDDFFDSGNVPQQAAANAELKSRTLFWLKRGGSSGMQVDGAYRLALSELAEKTLFGQQSQATQPAVSAATSKPRSMPAVEIGGGRRNLMPQRTADDSDLDYTGIDKNDQIRNLRALFNRATQVSQEAPMDGASAGKYGVRAYNDTKPPV